MKHEITKMDVFKLEEKEVRNIKEFNGRDITELCPTIAVVKRFTDEAESLSVIIEVADEFSATEFACPWSEVKFLKGFSDENDIAGFVEYMLDRNVLNWAGLLEFYDESKQ